MTQALWRDATQWDSEPAYAQRDRGDLVPLLIMVLVTALFFMSDHTLTAPQMAVENSTMAITLDALQGISEGSIWRRVAFFGFGIFGVAAIAWRPRWHVRIKGALAWSVLLYLGWACLSLAWTDDPGLTVRRLAVLALISVGVAGLLHQLTRQGIVALITFSSLSYLVIGFVNELAKGTFVPLASGYRFAGTLHPAEQGINCSFLILGAICMADCVRRHRRFFFGCAAFGIVFLLLTRSRTAAGTLLVAGFIYWNLGAYRVRLRALTLVGIAGFGLAVWLFLIVNHVVPAPWTLILMGRTSATAGTLTGRIPLWEMLLQFAAQHPVLGYGYNSFMGPKHAAQIIAVIWWGFNSAHSAYIATLLDLGAIGLVVLIAVLGLSTRRAMSLFRVYRDPTIAFFAALLVLEILTGLLDATLVFPSPRMWTLLVIGYLAFRDPADESVARDATPEDDPNVYATPELVGAAQLRHSHSGWPMGS